MILWMNWWIIARQLAPAFSRRRSFLWFSVVLMAMSVRTDLRGVTSFIRALGLQNMFYQNLLDFFHSSAMHPGKLARIWTCLVLKLGVGVRRVNGMVILVADGIKLPKSGRKMPAVKLLHQESESNTKPAYIMGHSCQVVGVLLGVLETVFCVPLKGEIHEGLKFSNRDRRTLLDKLVAAIMSLEITDRFLLVADAYYASAKVVLPFLEKNCHLISRVRNTAVAYAEPLQSTGKRGRGAPRKYGDKQKLKNLFDGNEGWSEVPSPYANERGVMIRYRSIDLLWRPVGTLIRFVATIHPTRGKIILMCTDLTLWPVDIISIYGLRFKIEVSFKAAIHSLGVYAYHFWMSAMTPIPRRGGNQHLHKKSEKYREGVRRKLGAYHRHIQVGLIAQGLLQLLSCLHHQLVFDNLGSWFRTRRPNRCPSEAVVSAALRHTLPQFLAAPADGSILAKFLLERMDFDSTEGNRLIA